jgi:hypothetical protein
MKHRFPLSVFVGVVAGLQLVVINGFAVAQDSDPRLRKIFDDWEKRQNRIHSILYRVQGTHLIPKGSVMDPIRNTPIKPENPAQDLRLAVQRTLLLDFATNRHRLEIDEERYDARTQKQSRQTATTLFDGSVVKGMGSKNEPTPESPNTPPTPNISVLSGNLKNAGFQSIHWPMFLGHGIIVPIGGIIIPGKLKIMPDIELFRVHGEGVHDGRPCLVIRTQALQAAGTLYDEFWVDTQHDSAVVRQALMANGKPSLNTDIQYQQTAHGWLPSGWTFTLFTNDRTSFVEHLEVKDLAINLAVADADFQFEDKPGMLIKKIEMGGAPDPRHPMVFEEKEKKYFRVGDDGSLAEVTFKDGIERKRWSTWIGWAIGLLLLVALSLWLIPRWIRRRAVGARSSQV